MAFIFDGSNWSGEWSSPPDSWSASRAPYVDSGDPLPALGGYRFDDQLSGAGERQVIWTSNAVDGSQTFQHELHGFVGHSARLLIEEITWDGTPGTWEPYTVVRTVLDETLTLSSDGTTLTTHTITTNGSQILRIQADTDGTEYASPNSSNYTAVTLLDDPDPTNNETLTARYVDLESREPKPTALIAPGDVQRSIDTHVQNLLDFTHEWTCPIAVQIDELSNYVMGSTINVMADAPGIRSGKNLRLVEIDASSALPHVPIRFTFRGKP